MFCVENTDFDIEKKKKTEKLEDFMFSLHSGNVTYLLDKTNIQQDRSSRGVPFVLRNKKYRGWKTLNEIIDDITISAKKCTIYF